MIQDANTQKYLDIFANVDGQMKAAIRKAAWLDDVQRCPKNALKFHFGEQGLAYPDFPEVTDTILRTILLNSESIHAKRYTLAGLEAYIGYFVDAGVNVTVVSTANNYMHLGVTNIGLPNAEMLADQNSCFYLYKDQPLAITITFADTVSNEMKEFFEKTLKYEFPFGDSLDANITINVP